MADIVRLTENGVTKYVETHAEAVIGLRAFLDSNDTGWQSLAPASGQTWQSLYPGMYRVINNVLYLKGAIINTGGEATGKVIATLPNGFAPESIHRTLQRQMSGLVTEFAGIDIGTDGAITVVGAVANKNVYLDGISFPLKKSA